MKQYKYMLQDGDLAYAQMPMRYDSTSDSFVTDGEIASDEVFFAGIGVISEKGKKCYVEGSKRQFVETMGKKWLDNAIDEGSAVVEDVGKKPLKKKAEGNKKEADPPTPINPRVGDVSMIEDILSIHAKYEREIKGNVDLQSKITQDQHDYLLVKLDKSTYYDVTKLIDDYAAECEEKHIPLSKRKTLLEVMAPRSEWVGKKSKESRSEIKSIMEIITQVNDDNTYYITNAYIRGVGRVPVHAKKGDHMLEVQAIMDEVCRKYGFPSYAILPGTYEGELPRIIHWDILEKIKNDNRKD